MLRRTKDAVALDLPEKTEIADAMELLRSQRAVYESIRLAMYERAREYWPEPT